MNPLSPRFDPILSKYLELVTAFTYLVAGFEATQMNCRPDGQVHGFALFTTRDQAISACGSIANLHFDRETNCYLRCEVAKKNMYIKQHSGP